MSTAQSENLIAQMIQSHSVGDFCIVGEKVCRATRNAVYLLDRELVKLFLLMSLPIVLDMRLSL